MGNLFALCNNMVASVFSLLFLPMLAVSFQHSAFVPQVSMKSTLPRTTATSMRMSMPGMGPSRHAKIPLGGSATFQASSPIRMGAELSVDGGDNQPPSTPTGGDSRGDGDDSDGSSNPLMNLWSAYETQLESNPLLTKGMTSLVGFTIGDLLAQVFIDKKESIDWKRVAKLASFGLLLHGTSGHYFYNFLDAKIPGTGAAQVVSKVFIDQVIWNPIFGVFFFGYVSTFDGMKPKETVARIKKDLMTAVTGSWKVWPIAHAINFKFVPSSQRLLYINTIQIFYNMFLSVISNRGDAAQA